MMGKTQFLGKARILDIIIRKDKNLVCAFEASDIVCWLVNLPIATLDLFKSAEFQKLTQSIVIQIQR